MASRKKPAPAALRTVNMFTGLTPIEEAANVATEEEDRARPPADRSDFGVRDALVNTALKWLGHDILAEGDDCVFVEGPRGGFLSIIHGGKGGAPRKTFEVKLSSAHIAKLRNIFGEG